MDLEVLMDAEEKMEKSLESFNNEMARIRTSRANPAMLDSVEVEAYGSKMKLNQLGTITVLDAQMLQVDLWDKSQINVVEKALRTPPHSFSTSNDGRVIRVPIPALNEERRRELVKLASKHLEEARVSVRNVRRQAVDEIKKMQKDGELPEDDAHRASDEVQKLTDRFIKLLEDTFAAKEKDIMEV
jgi:ribosome recycling factor